MAVQKLSFVKQGVIHYKVSSATLEFFFNPRQSNLKFKSYMS